MMSEEQDWRIDRLGLERYDALLALWRRARLHSIRPEGRDSRCAMARQLATGVQAIFGLLVEVRLVGAVVATHDSRKGWINRLAVDQDFRRRGHAARLVHAAEDWLHAQHIEVVATLVVSGNDPSLALFRKLGYTELAGGIHYLSKRPSEKA